MRCVIFEVDPRPSSDIDKPRGCFHRCGIALGIRLLASGACGPNDCKQQEKQQRVIPTRNHNSRLPFSATTVVPDSFQWLDFVHLNDSRALLDGQDLIDLDIAKLLGLPGGGPFHFDSVNLLRLADAKMQAQVAL